MDHHLDATIKFAEGIGLQRREAVLASKKMRSFLAKARAGFDFRGGTVQYVKWFGKNQDTVGFIVFEADALTRDGQSFPGTVTFIRGDAEAVLVVLVTPDGREWAVLTRQPRLATGSDSYAEIPAGMVDEGVFRSTAIHELEEEIGADLEIRAENLVHIASIQPSAGACDETVNIYHARREVPQSYVDSLQGRMGGLEEEGERIAATIVPLHDLPDTAPADAKTLVAYYGYMAARGLVASEIPSQEELEQQASPAGMRP